MMSCRNAATILWAFCVVVLSCAISLEAVETVRVDADSGVPRIMVDGQPVRARIFFGGPGDTYASQIKMAASAGVDLVSFRLKFPWPKPGQKTNWSQTDKQCKMVLDANPNALLLPRIYVGPPAWWCKSHPDDVMKYDSGKPTRSNGVVASAVYQRDVAKHLTALVKHLESKFGRHIAGYHIAGQNTGEWFYQDTWSGRVSGYSKSSLTAWRAWLKSRYRTNNALRAAWHAKKVTLLTAEVPSAKARRASPAGTLRSPTSEQPVIDFATFQQEAMADCICNLAHVVRVASRNRKLVVAFYGYTFEFASVGSTPATSGHYALRRILDCPDIDILCSPISYHDRGLGESAPAMSAAESVTLAGKMWLYEDDTHTCLAKGNHPGWRDGVDTIEETNNELLRNTAQCAVRNFGTWWMDLLSDGRFNDQRMWKEMDRLKAIDQPLLENPIPFCPEVAVVVDEPTMVRTAPAGVAVAKANLYNVRESLGRLGAPYGQYLQDDVLDGKVKAKMYVFLNAWRLSAVERKKLQKATRDSLCVWCYAAGMQDGDRNSLDAVRQVTGFNVKAIYKVAASAKPTPLGKQYGFRSEFGLKKSVRPLLALTNVNQREVLATYSNGTAAVALRRTRTGASLFVGPPGLNTELLRLAANYAGVHLYTQTDCNVYANGPFVVLHGSQDGTIELNVGSATNVYDLLTRRPLGQGPVISLPLKKGETRIFYAPEKEGN